MPKPSLPASEEIMYLRWERSVVPGSSYQLRDGRRLVVLSRGQRNRSAGPDYPGALLLLEGELLSGAVEMHRQESEWYAHGHHTDAAYGDVVLHLVAADTPNHPVDLPTLHYAELVEVDDDLPRCTADSQQASLLQEPLLQGDLLAEYAWRRLLRRTHQVIAECRGDFVDPSETPSVRTGALDSVALRRSFIRLAIDGLGYQQNRPPMRRLAEAIIVHEEAIKIAASSSNDLYEYVALIVFSEGGIPFERLASAGGTDIDPALLLRLRRGLEGGELSNDWDYDTRPGNLPERRIWGVVDLVVGLYGNGLLVELAGRLLAGGVEEAAQGLVTRRGSRSFIGEARAREIVVNGLLPLLLAGALASRESSLIEAICGAYRTAGSLPTNRLLAGIERRYLDGRRIVGAFWQQGAIELHQCLYGEMQAPAERVAEYSETGTGTGHQWQTKSSTNTLWRRERSPISIQHRPSLVGIRRPTCPTAQPRRAPSSSRR